MNRKYPPYFQRIRGLTLIESLLYIALVSGVVIAASIFAWNIIGSKTKSTSIREVDSQATFALERILRTARMSNGIVGTSSTDVNLAEAGQSSESFGLLMPTPATTPVVFTVDQGVLMMSQGGNTPLALTSNRVQVTDLSFTDLSDNDGQTVHISVDLTLQHVNPEQRQEYQAVRTLHGAAELRGR